MMVAVAQSDGAMTDRERKVIVAELVARVGATERQAEELLAHGRWLMRDVRDIDHCLDKLAPLIKRQCSPNQNRDVLEMLYSVASVEGRPGDIEGAALARLARALRDWCPPGRTHWISIGVIGSKGDCPSRKRSLPRRRM